MNAAPSTVVLPALPPDLGASLRAIIDVLLGRQTAYPLAELLAARGIPFVFATGQSAAAIEPGHSAIAVLVKPFSANLFEAAIRAIASKHAHHATPQDGSGPHDPP